MHENFNLICPRERLHSSFLQERLKAWQHWQHCSASLTKKREAKVKAELQYRADK